MTVNEAKESVQFYYPSAYIKPVKTGHQDRPKITYIVYSDLQGILGCNGDSEDEAWLNAGYRLKPNSLSKD